MNTFTVKDDKKCDICGKPFDVKYTTDFGKKIYSSCYNKLRTEQAVKTYYICPECANKVAEFVKDRKLEAACPRFYGKCGSCIYSEPTTWGKSKVWVRCTNEAHLKDYCRNPSSDKRPRTQPACKSYKCRG